MARVNTREQTQQNLKLLVILLGNPHLRATEIAKVLKQSEGWVNRKIGEFRDAGVDVEWDHGNRRYKVVVTPELEASIAGRLAKKVAREVKASEITQPPVRFVSSLDRYSVKDFAQLTGLSESAVSDALTGYNGARLPAGWCGYQIRANGKWFIQKMTADRSGKKFTIPENIRDVAHTIVVGEGSPVERKMSLERKICSIPGCRNTTLAKGYCSPHYYQVRRGKDPRGLRPFKVTANARAATGGG